MDRQEMLEKARAGVKAKYSRKDNQIIQAVRSLGDLDDAKSLLFQRLDEWFKTNFPEFSLGNEETYARVVAEYGCREDFDFNGLQEIVGEKKAADMMAFAEKSFGAPFDVDDRKAAQSLARQIVGLCEARKQLEEYVVLKAKQEMPNVSVLAGELLAARLLSLAGSLERLAEMPASTIQVIGAEKALFKHLRSGSLPPKHGIIFQSPLINSAPLDKRGKVARALATKLCIAVKADYFTGNDIATKLKADLEKRLQQINALPHRNVKPVTRDDFRGKHFDSPRRPYAGKSGFAREGGFRPSGDRSSFQRRDDGFRHPSAGKGEGFRRPDAGKYGVQRREGGFRQGVGERRFGSKPLGKPFVKRSKPAPHRRP